MRPAGSFPGRPAPTIPPRGLVSRGVSPCRSAARDSAPRGFPQRGFPPTDLPRGVLSRGFFLRGSPLPFFPDHSYPRGFAARVFPPRGFPPSAPPPPIHPPRNFALSFIPDGISPAGNPNVEIHYTRRKRTSIAQKAPKRRYLEL